jgi:hypothetical protein
MEKTFETPGPVALDVRVPMGEVIVDAGLTGRVEVELTAHDDESQALVDAARVEARDTAHGGHEIAIDVPTKRSGFGLAFIFGRQGITCRVRCPEGTELAVRSKSADVTARGLLGGVNVNTASGDVEVDRVSGGLNVKSASGDISAGSIDGGANVHTASGDIELGVVQGPVNANTMSGDLSIEAAYADVNANTVSGDQTHEAVMRGSISAHSVSGDVVVGVRRGSRVYLDCTTVSGDTSSELEVSGEPAPGDGPTVEIKAKTVSGDIRITRAPAPADSAQEVHA